MCNVLYREGSAWALDSIANLHNVVGKRDQFRQLINYPFNLRRREPHGRP